MKCRHCGAEVSLPLVDLGSAPPSNAYLTEAALHRMEKWYPLRVMVCTECWLAQTEDTAAADELFDENYAYFSSYSSTWLRHAEQYVASMQTRFRLNEKSHVVEIAANDGYLLQFVKARGIPCLGVEPTISTAATARAKGIDILEEFFGVATARLMVNNGQQADLMIANNVLAHVPDINDFVAGFSELLKPSGVATFEFPHLMQLMADCQFDTVYHEHFSYLSFTAVNGILNRCGLSVFDVEPCDTHGGSLRVFAQRKDAGLKKILSSVNEMLAKEKSFGMTSPSFYADFQHRTNKIKNAFLLFLLESNHRGAKVVAYGAAAKGNTLINYAGVRPDLLKWVVDRNPSKQGKFLPGSRIPIVDEAYLKHERPDYVVILPWNLKDEIKSQLIYIRAWGGKFVTVVPDLKVER
jgi:SAM-dependent methyltransferase